MEVSQHQLAVFVAACFLLGILLGAAYDLTALLPALAGKVFSPDLHKRLEKRNKWCIIRRERRIFVKAAVFVHDILFMTLSGCAVALAIYLFNDGVFRISALGTLFFGVVLYVSLLRRFVLMLAELMRFAAAVICGIIAYPFVKLAGLIAKVIVNARRCHVDSAGRKKLLKLSKNGFIDPLDT